MLPEYVYVLGLYRGDGNLARTGGTYTLRITLDARYPSIIDAAASALGHVAPPHRPVRVRVAGRRTHRRMRVEGLAATLSSARARSEAHASHRSGRMAALPRRRPPGRVSARVDPLGWLPSRQPLPCEPTLWPARVRVYRYFFTNMSSDIRGLFSEYCGRMGVRCTRSNFKTISVADRRSVALLDSFIGPKS